MEEIIPGLWLGSIDDVKCGTPEEIDTTYPIHRWLVFNDTNEEFTVQSDLLDSLTFLIHTELNQSKNVLVYCSAGIERSPLVIAWYLCKYHQYKTLDDAYDKIMSKRDVYNQSHWVSWDDRYKLGLI